jgi:transcriptional regulator MftR-like protein
VGWEKRFGRFLWRWITVLIPVAVIVLTAASGATDRLSARSGRPVDDYQLRVTTAAFVAAQLEAARYWADTEGAESLAQLMDDAVTLVEPLIAAL